MSDIHLVLERAEDTIETDPCTYLETKEDEKIWSAIYQCIQSSIKRKKRGESIIVEDIEYFATFFKVSLFHLQQLLSPSHKNKLLEEYYRGRLDAHTEDFAAITLISRSLICLGDVYRYLSPFDPAHASIYLEQAKSAYHDSLRTYPKNGRASAHIALLCTQNTMEMMYWFSISCLAVIPSKTARVGLKKYLSKTAETPLETLVMCCHNSASVPFNLITQISLKPFESEFEVFCMSICMMTHVILDGDFANSDTKKMIREHQTYLMYIILRKMKAVCDNISGVYLADGASLGEKDIKQFHMLSICCLWLQRGAELTQFQKYLFTFEDKNELKQSMIEMFQSLSNAVNELTMLIDVDRLNEYVYLDRDFLGLEMFQREFSGYSGYENVLDDFCMDESDVISILASRCFSLCMALSKDASVPEFICKQGAFEYLDIEQKKMNTMKKMALRRLEDQNVSLEFSIQAAQRKKIPFIIPSVDILTQDFDQLKHWIMKKMCIVIVSLNVIDQLDSLKNGTDGVMARNASRFLEQKFKLNSPYVQAQKKTESVACAVKDDALREIMSCARYYVNSKSTETVLIVSNTLSKDDVPEDIVVVSSKDFNARYRTLK